MIFLGIEFDSHHLLQIVIKTAYLSRFLLCAGHGTNLTGESPVTGIYRQV